jgi:hypothetical protein
VDAAAAGDTVLVADGVYSTGGRVVPGSLSNRVFIDKAILVQSVNGPEVTVIEGASAPEDGGNGDGAVRCAYLGPRAELRGFTLTKGHTRRAGNEGSQTRGGGAYCYPNARLTDCIIRNNGSYSDGGGVQGGSIYQSQLVDNVAFSSGSPNDSGDGDGGGANACTLYNCILTGNRARKGGAVDDCTLYGCVLTGNDARVFGGGAARSTLYNCTLTSNASRHGGGAGEGGVLYNCIVYHNSALFGPNHEEAVLHYSCTTPLPAGGTGNIAADPMLASHSHVSAASPCVGAGFSLYASGLDIDGQPWSAAPSMGADQLTTGAATGLIQVVIEHDFTRMVAGYAATFGASITGNITASRWSLGDGTVIDNRLEVVHNWKSPGLYPVELRAFNDSFPLGVASTVMVQVTEQSVHFVNLASPSPAAPYSTMQTAAANIQDAIGASDVAGRLVLVAAGTYDTGGVVVEGTMTNRVALLNGVTVRSLDGPAATIIRGAPAPGGGLGDGAVRCAYVGVGCVLEGFTLTNGHTRTAGHSSREQGGGGAWCDGTAVVSRCLFTGNRAFNDGGGANGGNFFACTFAANTAQDEGGGVDDAVLHNCTLLGDSSVEHGGAASESNLRHCTMVDNSTWSTWLGATWSVVSCVLTNCIIEPSGSSNPKFVDAAGGNFRLRSDSPYIDAGTAMENPLPTDFDGKPRSIDGNHDGRMAPDMGAFEYGVVLGIARTGEGGVLSWVAAPGESYKLEETTNLTTWTVVPGGGTSPVSIEFTPPGRFFRLMPAPLPTARTKPTDHPPLPALRSGHRILQRPSSQQQILSSYEEHPHDLHVRCLGGPRPVRRRHRHHRLGDGGQYQQPA